MHNVIVIGASAGGVKAVKYLASQLQPNLNAAVFVVIHTSAAAGNNYLVRILGDATKLRCRIPETGEEIQEGTLYIAPVDKHMIIKENIIITSSGARENKYRPAIDPLFRSAAAYYASHVVGIVLTGMLDDGSAGLEAIKKCGGVAIVQSPEEAEYPDMPMSALANVEVDYCVGLEKIAALIPEILHLPKADKHVPYEVKKEVEISERVLVDINTMNEMGEQINFSCPDCGGSLWKINGSGVDRFRCHVGHSHTLKSLMLKQEEMLQETLWVALRMMEERRNMYMRLMEEEKNRGRIINTRGYEERASQEQVHIERIRNILLKESDEESNSNYLAQVNQ